MPKQYEIFLVALVCLAWMLSNSVWGQPVAFHENEQSEHVDYHSFAPQMLLKHHFGSEFRKLPKNPVLRPGRGGWDRKDVADPYVVVTADSVLLFYDGDARDRYQIGYARRDAQGWGWEKRGRILSGSGGAWDAYHQIAPVVLRSGDQWRIYYNGHFEDEELGYRWGVALGKAEGGWQYPSREALIALDSTAWDFAGNAYGDIIYFPEEHIYRMWYTGFQGPLAAIGLATSRDGIAWQKRVEGPVLTALPGVISPDVLFDGERYRMFYVQLALSAKGMGTQIMSAESKDGIVWENMTEVLQPAARWEGKRLMRPHVSYFEGRVQLYYCAGRGGDWQIGAAWCEAEFVPQGRWRSAPLKAGGKLRIKYEQPEGTSLSLTLHAGGNIYPLTLPQSQTLRAGVFMDTMPLPAQLAGKNINIELQFHTTDTHRSPVVYEIVML